MSRNGTNPSSKRRNQPKVSCAREANLVFVEEIFDEKTVQGLIDEWIVPGLVEAYLRILMSESQESKG